MKLVERPEPQGAALSSLSGANYGDVIVQVHASGFTGDELAWPSTWIDRLYSFVAITGISIIRIPVAPEPSVEKSAIVAAIESAWEKPAIVAAKVPSREKPAIVAAEDPPGEEPVLAAKVPSKEKPAIVAAEDPASREKPAIVAAKVREAYVHSNPATAAPTPTNPVLCNGVRWIPNCQRGQHSENSDALQHDSLLYPSATPPPGITSQRA